MTDVNAGLNAEDIIDDADDQRAKLDQEADLWIANAEARSFARSDGLRQTVRADVEAGRAWAKGRAASARSHIEEEPLKATLYALGIGVLIGVLLRR